MNTGLRFVLAGGFFVLKFRESRFNIIGWRATIDDVTRQLLRPLQDNQTARILYIMAALVLRVSKIKSLHTYFSMLLCG